MLPFFPSKVLFLQTSVTKAAVRVPEEYLLRYGQPRIQKHCYMLESSDGGINVSAENGLSKLFNPRGLIRLTNYIICTLSKYGYKMPQTDLLEFLQWMHTISKAYA